MEQTHQHLSACHGNLKIWQSHITPGCLCKQILPPFANPEEKGTVPSHQSKHPSINKHILWMFPHIEAKHRVLERQRYEISLWQWCILKWGVTKTIRPTGASCLTWKWLNAKMEIAADSSKQPGGGGGAQIPVRPKNTTLNPFSVLIDLVQNDRLSSSVHWSQL